MILGPLPPFIIILFDCLSIIRTLFSSNCAIYPLSQKVPMDRRALSYRPGKICASLAFNARSLFFRRAVWDECIITPFGIFIGRVTRRFVCIHMGNLLPDSALWCLSLLLLWLRKECY